MVLGGAGAKPNKFNPLQNFQRQNAEAHGEKLAEFY
jgi:hypothetical protein